jgi:toxin HigB-1
MGFGVVLAKHAVIFDIWFLGAGQDPGRCGFVVSFAGLVILPNRPAARTRRIATATLRAALTLDVCRQCLYTDTRMIVSYKNKRTERFAGGESVRAFQGFEQQAERRLAILHAAPSLETLRALPGNRLEALRGDRAGQYSIRINQQWRICFEWPDGQPGPGSVEIVDYHR